MGSGPQPYARVAHPSVWSASQHTARRDWLYTFGDDERAELAAVSAGVPENQDLIALRRSDLPLPRLAETLRAVREEVLHGRGFVVLRGLPLAELGRRRSAVALWAIGRHIGDSFASQNARGHLLGQVTDLGESRSNADQRGPYSHDRIPYHVDCCDIVALMCLQVARRGGESAIASSGAIYNALLERRPDLIPGLTRPIYRDRRGEIPPGMAPWYALPVFNHHAGLLSVSIEPTYIGSVKRHFRGIDPHTAAQREGIREVQAIAHRLRLDIEFQRGDIQLVNNHVIMHSRQAFEDDPQPHRRRHLVRLWMCNHDGRPLPRAYYLRHGTPGRIRRPGGIVGANTIVNAELSAIAP